VSALRDEALRLASEGIVVFPMARASSRPAVEGGYHGASSDPEAIRAWWGADPTFNVGMPMRPNGLIALDVDPRNGGEVTFAACERKLGPLPRELCARSGGGGLHLILREPPNQILAGRRPRGRLDHLGLGRGVDVKCNGYLVVEPSVHHKTGAQYRWLCERPTALSIAMAPEVPEAWLDALYHPRLDDKSGDLGIEAWERTVDGPLSSAEVLALREKLAALGPRCGGNATTFRAIRTVFHDWGLSLDDGWAQLAWWSEQSGKPHGQAELERRVLSVAADGTDEDGTFGHRGWARPSASVAARLARAGIGVASAVAPPDALPPRSGGDPVAVPAVQEALDILDADPGVSLPPGSPVARYLEELRRAVDDVAAALGRSAEGGDAAERPFFMSAGELFAMPDERPEWLVRNLVLDGGIGLIGAEPKIGKTWIATEIAVAVASGTPVFGKYAAKPGRVMYFYTEDMREAVRSHLLALCAGRGMSPRAVASTLYCQPRGRSIDLSKPDDVARLVASARVAGGCKLMVLDPLRNVHEGEEDSSDSMAVVFKHVRLISVLLGCTVLLVHHAKKASEATRNQRPGQTMRGSGAIHGFVDSGIYLRERRGDACSITSTLESEVKAARSAGVFDVTLKLVDDAESGVAREARWEIAEKGAGAATDDQVETWEELAMQMVDACYRAEVARKPLVTSEQIKSTVKGRTETKHLALKLATSRGWFVQERARGKYALTDAGRALSKSRHGGVEQPSA
jgi:hypothetical protein